MPSRPAIPSPPRAISQHAEHYFRLIASAQQAQAQAQTGYVRAPGELDAEDDDDDDYGGLPDRFASPVERVPVAPTPQPYNERPANPYNGGDRPHQPQGGGDRNNYNGGGIYNGGERQNNGERGNYERQDRGQQDRNQPDRNQQGGGQQGGEQRQGRDYNDRQQFNGGERHNRDRNANRNQRLNRDHAARGATISSRGTSHPASSRWCARRPVSSSRRPRCAAIPRRSRRCGRSRP